MVNILMTNSEDKASEDKALEHFAKMFQGVEDQDEFIRRISVFNLVGLLLTMIMVEKMSDIDVFSVALNNFKAGVKNRINNDINYHAEMCNTIVGKLFSSVVEDPEEARVRTTTILEECCKAVEQLYDNIRDDVENEE